MPRGARGGARSALRELKPTPLGCRWHAAWDRIACSFSKSHRAVEERLALRQRESTAVWQSLGEWLESKPAADVLPKSKLGEALGRKNWLFIGSVAGGKRAADFLTLVNSAVRNDLDVWAYLKDVLDRLPAGDTGYVALQPDVWRQAHPEAVREYRVAERRDCAGRKQFRRAERRRLRSESPR